MVKDPYKILGVSKKSSDAEIRKAYRALAKKYHPDVNPDNKAAEKKFKEISAAHNLLSDKNLRAQYDQGQIDGSGQQRHPFSGQHNPFGAGNPFGGRRAGGQQPHDMSDLFSSLFGMNMGGGGQARMRAKKGTSVKLSLPVEFMDTLTGSKKRINISGKSIALSIKAGAKDGDILRLKGKGQPGQNGGQAGDALITLKVKSHKYLSRKGKNLYLNLPITLKEAVLGGKVTVPMPTGKISLNIPKGASSGQMLRLKSKGIEGGDLYIRLMVSLKDENMKALESVLSETDGQNLRKSIL